MSPAALQAILKRLPPGQHDAATRRIAAAEAFGWRLIGFWAWDGNPTLDDLVGSVVADGKSRLHFLSELDEPQEA